MSPPAEAASHDFIMVRPATAPRPPPPPPSPPPPPPFILPQTFEKGSISVPTLDGSNYSIWRRAMRVLFMKVGVLPLIEADTPVPPDALWIRCDRWTFSEIFFSCGAEQQLSLDETMTARQAWDTLAELYQSASLGNIFRLTLEFNSLKQSPGQPAIQFINSVWNAASELRFLGEEVSDQKIKWQILGNLLPAFGPLVTTLSNIDKPDAPTAIASLREAILREERQIAIRSLSSTPTVNPSSTPVPASATSTMPPPTTAFPSNTQRCPFCNLRSHTADNCWTKYPHKAPDWWKPRSTSSSRSKDHSRHRSPSRSRGGSPHSRSHHRSRDSHRDRSPSRKRRSSDRKGKRRRRSTSRDSSSSGSSSRSPVRKRRHTRQPKRETLSEIPPNTSDHQNDHALIMLSDNIPCVPGFIPPIDHCCMMRVQQSPSSGISRWMLDSGASNHYTANRTCFVTYRKIHPLTIETASHPVHAVAIGDVVLHLTCGPIRLTDVMHVPDMVVHTNLISVGQLESKGITFTIKNGVWNLWKEGSLWAIATRDHSVYFLQEISHPSAAMVSFPISSGVLAYPASTTPAPNLRIDTQDIDVWHRRMGHLNRKYIQLLKSLAEGMDIGHARKYRLDCPDCVQSSQRRVISHFPMRQPDTNLEILYADICGPMQEPDFWGHRYFALFVCAKSRYKFLYPLFQKSDVREVFKVFKAWSEK